MTTTVSPSEIRHAMAAIRITPGSVVREASDVPRTMWHGFSALANFSEDELAIATTPKQEIYRDDMVRLYRYLPTVEDDLGIPVLVVYALVGRYQMIDLEQDRSFVRKLLDAGLTVYMVDWGLPTRAQRWTNIDDYVSGYLDDCVDVIREREGVDKINLLGICQGGVFSTCYAALFPDKLATLTLAVTPLDFHGDAGCPQPGTAYMNLWARGLTGEDIDRYVAAHGTVAGDSVGLGFLMMDPVANAGKYTVDLLSILGDDRRLLNFLRMERWMADRPSTPGEVARQWLKDLYQDNKLVKNELVLGGRSVDLRNITMPVLNVYAEGDVVVPNSTTRGVGPRLGTSDYTELGVPGGHIGTFVGGKAQRVLGPGIVDWLKARNGSRQ
ncbi:MAG TPA: alpha/beta fold hydrolase [Mycobacterium sp.]|nr:alpha/beta fold hydrolase [Mycobacterium sp.]